LWMFASYIGSGGVLCSCVAEVASEQGRVSEVCHQQFLGRRDVRVCVCVYWMWKYWVVLPCCWSCGGVIHKVFSSYGINLLCSALILNVIILVRHSFVLGTRAVTGQGHVVTMVAVEWRGRVLRVTTATRSTTHLLRSWAASHAANTLHGRWMMRGYEPRTADETVIAVLPKL
jgi:hypothetical protein